MNAASSIDWTQVILAAITVLGNLAIVMLGLTLRSQMRTSNGTAIGTQVEQANTASAATLVQTTQLLKEHGLEPPPLVDAAKAGLSAVAEVAPIVAASVEESSA